MGSCTLLSGVATSIGDPRAGLDSSRAALPVACSAGTGGADVASVTLEASRDSVLISRELGAVFAAFLGGVSRSMMQPHDNPERAR